MALHLQLSGTPLLQHLLVPNTHLAGGLWGGGGRGRAGEGPAYPVRGAIRGDLAILQMRKPSPAETCSMAERGLQPRLQGRGCDWRGANTLRDTLQIPS